MKEILVADCSQPAVYDLANCLSALPDLRLTAIAASPIEPFTTQNPFTVYTCNSTASFPFLSGLYNSELAQNRLNTAFFVYQPLSKTVDVSKFSDAAHYLNSTLSFYLLFLRQLDQFFSRAEGGLLIPVLQTPSETASELESAAYAAIVAFLEALMHRPRLSYTVCGLQIGTDALSLYTETLIAFLQNPPKKSGWALRAGKKSFFRF